MKDLNRIIRTLRENKKLTIRQMSALSGIAYSTIVSVELGVSKGTMYTVETLLDTLGYELKIVEKKR